MEMVKKGCPVVAVKSIGGASEKMSQFFDDRMFIDPLKKPGEGPNRHRGYADRYPARAIDPMFHEVLFTLPKEGMLDSQLICLDAVDPNVGQSAQKQMAELLTHQQVDEERQLGFAAAEKARLSKAWQLAVLYQNNAARAKVQADALNFLMCENWQPDSCFRVTSFGIELFNIASSAAAKISAPLSVSLQTFSASAR
jgi:hypothetical protein